MRGSIAICLLLSCLTGCTGKDGVPSGILNKQKMQVVLWDILEADQFTRIQVQRDSLKDPVTENAQLQKQIFDKDTTSRDQFYKSYAFYKAHPQLMQEVVDSLISKEELVQRTVKWKTPVLPHKPSPQYQVPLNPFQPRAHGQGLIKR